jgi:hypothetical protein
MYEVDFFAGRGGFSAAGGVTYGTRRLLTRMESAMVDANARRRRMWMPSDKVDHQAALAIEWDRDKPPTMQQHRDRMEFKIAKLLAMNDDQENKRIIETYVNEASDLLIWATPDGYAAALMSCDSMWALLNEIDWDAEAKLAGAAPDYTEEEIQDTLDDMTLGGFLSNFPSREWD